MTNMPPRYEISQVYATHISQVPVETYVKYWDDLITADRLRFRLCDTVNPTWKDIHRMFQINMNHMYLAMYKDTPVGEFMLNNFSGKAAQVHFSVHPSLHIRIGIPVVREIVWQILNWKVQGQPNEYYLHSLVGLTPVTNRAACIYVLRVGFQKRFILEAGMCDRGEIVDAMLTTCTREDLINHGR